jgi:hypothetical protein
MNLGTGRTAIRHEAYFRCVVAGAIIADTIAATVGICSAATVPGELALVIHTSVGGAGIVVVAVGVHHTAIRNCRMVTNACAAGIGGADIAVVAVGG